MDTSKEFPKIEELFKHLDAMNSSELLGALHCFEIQQPEVARTKKEGLIKYYGFNEKDLIYFNEHIDEDEHIKFGKMLSEQYANKDDFIKGFNQGADILYKTLDLFV